MVTARCPSRTGVHLTTCGHLEAAALSMPTHQSPALAQMKFSLPRCVSGTLHVPGSGDICIADVWWCQMHHLLNLHWLCFGGLFHTFLTQEH